MKGAVNADPAMLARLHAAAAAADRGARLTQQLLAFARRQPLAAQPTNVARLVTDLADLLRHSLGERVAMELEITDEPWNAKIDPGQLENAILNLCINARDAMAEGGTLEIRLERRQIEGAFCQVAQGEFSGDFAVITIRDSGTGIPEEIRSRIFEPFFTTKPIGTGLGLGLDLVQRVVNKHFGTVAVESRPSATCFQVRIPLDRMQVY